ncbi:MAG TPA: alpha/beta hydrolase, partial [Trebonia sp.]
METLLPVGDVELCVDTVGSPTDIPLLLIGTTVATWDDDFVERLSGRLVIRYDLRDAGRSTTVDPDSPGYTLRDLVTDAVGVLDGLGIARAHVAGIATGGFIAQLLALDHPSRVASLALIGTRPVAPGPVDD